MLKWIGLDGLLQVLLLGDQEGHSSTLKRLQRPGIWGSDWTLKYSRPFSITETRLILIASYYLEVKSVPIEKLLEGFFLIFYTIANVIFTHQA